MTVVCVGCCLYVVKSVHILFEYLYFDSAIAFRVLGKWCARCRSLPPPFSSAMASPPSGGSTSSVTSAVAANFHTQLSQLSSGSVAHRDLSERYRAILDSIMQLVEG